MKKILRVVLILLGLLVFSVAGVFLYYYYTYGTQLIADSEDSPPYELWHQSYSDPKALKDEIVRFGHYAGMGRKARAINARRVMPRNMFSGINGWDYLSYQPGPSKFSVEVEKWKRMSDKDEAWRVEFFRPPAWWPDASQLELIAHIRDSRHEHIQFQKIFITKDNDRVYIYNDWGD